VYGLAAKSYSHVDTNYFVRKLHSIRADAHWIFKIRENIIRVQDNKLNTVFKLKIGQSKVMKVKGRSTLRYYVT
jgi:hypothetical protein